MLVNWEGNRGPIPGCNIMAAYGGASHGRPQTYRLAAQTVKHKNSEGQELGGELCQIFKF